MGQFRPIDDVCAMSAFPRISTDCFITATAKLVWIPPCRKKLERNQDYDVPPINWKVYRRPPVDRVNGDRIGL